MLTIYAASVKTPITDKGKTNLTRSEVAGIGALVSGIANEKESPPTKLDTFPSKQPAPSAKKVDLMGFDHEPKVSTRLQSAKKGTTAKKDMPLGKFNMD